MEKIERPDWYKLFIEAGRLNDWFDRNITPINDAIDKSVVVYGYNELEWLVRSSGDHYQHKALIMNIEPIKPDSAIDVLRDLVETIDSSDLLITDRQVARAKRVLEEHGDG